MELEKQIKSSFFKPGDDDKMREILRTESEKTMLKSVHIGSVIQCISFTPLSSLRGKGFHNKNSTVGNKRDASGGGNCPVTDVGR
jgi:hypothetical protein